MRTRKNLAQFVGIRRFSLKWTWIVLRNLFARMQLLCHKLNPRYCPRRRIESVIQNTTADYAQVMESGFAGRIALAQSLMDGAIEARCDFVECAKYHFTGMHGAGAANAANAMAAILETHAKKGAAGLKELLAALDGNFAHAEDLRECLVNEAPKVGTTNEMADRCLKALFDMYADVGEKFRNFRPGSGSAMFYVWLADVNNRPAGLIEPLVGATSDGRLQNAPLGASLAPAHEAKVRGVMSVFRSFAGIDYARIMNGGPVTIELSHSVFDSPMGTTKLGQLIQYFAALGGQQLQLNVLNVNELEDAIKHPERHRNLIVRVWGWSGYFVELAPEYQRQIIKRHRYG